MATKSIAWESGGGNITVDYDGSGDGQIVVTSSDNATHSDRSQTITVKTLDGSITRTVTVEQQAKPYISLDTAVVTAPEQTYSGSALTPAPTVTLGGVVVASGNYDVTWADNTNAGTGTVIVTGKGDYIGSASGSFTISKVTPTVVAPTAKVLTYNGGAQELVNAGSTDFGTLKYSLDYSTWSTNIPTGTDYGKYSVYYKVEGDSNVNDVSAVRVRCTINEKQVTATVELSQSSYTYSGSACTPDVTVKDGSTVIPANEYTVTYSNNVNAGTATVTITDNMGGNYDVIGSATFTIGKASINPYIIMSGWTYGGTASDPSVSGNPGDGSVSYSYKVSGAPDTSYSETKPSNAGDYVVRAVVAETSNYYGATVTNTFAIAKADPGYTAPTAKSLIYNGDYQDLLYAGSTSDGTIQYSEDGSTWGTSIPSGVGASTYTTYWRIIGDGNHNDKAAAGIETTIAKVTPSVTAPTAKSLTYTGSAQTLANAGSTNWGTLQYSLDNSSWGTSVPSGTSATGYTVYYRVVGNANVNDVAASYISCSIAKAVPSYTAPVASSLTYNGGAQYLVTAGSTSDGTIQYSGNGSDWSTTRPSQTNAGTYTTYWRLVGDANHTDVGSASISTTISKASGSVGTAPSAKSLTYTGSSQVLANAGSGTGTMYYRLGTSGDYSASMPSETNAGSWTLYYYAAESANYTQSVVGSISVGIDKAAGSVSVSGVNTSYSGSSQSLASVSGATGTMHYSTDYSNWSTSIPASTNAGSWTVYWYMDASANYESIAASTSRYVSSSIAKVNPTITDAPTNANPTYNGSAQYLLTGGTANVSGSFSYSTGTNAGSYTATWTFTPSDTTNYNTVSGNVSATIAKASRSLSFADSYAVLDTSSSVTKTATPSAGSGDGAVTYSINNTTYATINSSSGMVTSKTSDGSAVVSATIAEGTNYLSANASYNLYVFATNHEYNYSGSYVSLTLPPGTYKFQCWGAQGGSNAANYGYGIYAQAGGKGGYAEGQLTVSQATGIRAYVGGQGSSSAGGFNGGGSTTGTSSYSSSGEFGYSKMGGGGGATDIRLSDGALLSRMIVAGGGSGGAMCYYSYNTSTTVTDITTSTVSQQSGQFKIVIDSFPCVAGRTYTVSVTGYLNNYIWFKSTKEADPWALTDYDQKQNVYTYTVPSGMNYLHVMGFGDRQPANFTMTLTHEESSSGSYTDYQVGFVGGGATGGGYSSTYQGRQNAAGSGGSFGQGANQTASNYRYCSGAGGGGWYGGGGGQMSDSSTTYCKYSGGGSGWVNTYANRGNRPSGYTGLQLDSGSTVDGNSAMPTVNGTGTKYGQEGDGYVRITKI